MCAPPKDQDNIRFLLKNLSIILRLVSSQNYKIDVEKLNALCKKTYIFFLQTWPGFRVSETVHQLLAYSHELILGNDCFGLGKFSETCLETNNKFIKLFVERLSRKNSELVQLFDVMTRSWMKGDPIIRSKHRISFCTRFNIVGHFTRGCPKKKKQNCKEKFNFRIFSSLTF